MTHLKIETEEPLKSILFFNGIFVKFSISVSDHKLNKERVWSTSGRLSPRLVEQLDQQHQRRRIREPSSTHHPRSQLQQPDLRGAGSFNKLVVSTIENFTDGNDWKPLVFF